MRVLIVDDEDINRKVVAVLLSKRGIEVHEARSGAQSIMMAKVEMYDFILMDIRMPEMNGFDAARAIMESGGLSAKAPIIALTAHATDRDKEWAAAAGMKGFLRKPFSVEETMSMFNSLILDE
jgi:CheY-like chemotaxis protein